jgi:paraquat-inducible protein B
MFDQIQHPHAVIEAFIERGLRARLQTGSLLTGQMFIELGFYPDTPAVMVTGSRALAQIPTIPSEFVEMKQSATELLDKLRKLPLEELGEHAVGVIAELETLLKSPQISEVLTRANDSFAAFEQLSTSVGAILEPLAAQLDRALASVDGNSALHAQLSATLQQVDDAARALRDLAGSIERQPSALIWGKDGQRSNPESDD